MKALYTISLAITLFFGVTTFYYLNEYQQAWIDYLWSDILTSEVGSDYGYLILRDITTEGALISMVFIAFYIVLFSFTINRLKRITARVISIIGLIVSAIYFITALMPVVDPGNISFDELGSGLVLYVVAMMAFCIVNLVQCVRNEQLRSPNQETLDDMI